MKTKSSLGQHFLNSQGIVNRIIRLAEVDKDDAVLEIGPGTGVLTRSLIEKAARVVAVEKDDQLAARLKEKFKGSPTFTLIHQDILECSFKDLVSPGMKVVANLPYNIATQIILRLADVSSSLSTVVVMVQKEVGERICAHAGDTDYSALTVVLAAHFSCTPGFLVGPENFHPEPKVDSQVIRLVTRKDPLPASEIEDYRKVAFTVFGMRRKMLRNSLLGLPGMTRDLLPEIARMTGLSLNERPQTLDPETFSRLARAYRQILNP